MMGRVAIEFEVSLGCSLPMTFRSGPWPAVSSGFISLVSETAKNYVESTPQRAATVVAAKGGVIKY